MIISCLLDRMSVILCLVGICFSLSGWGQSPDTGDQGEVPQDDTVINYAPLEELRENAHKIVEALVRRAGNGPETIESIKKLVAEHAGDSPHYHKRLEGYIIGGWAAMLQLGAESPETIPEFVRMLEALTIGMDDRDRVDSPTRIMLYMVTGVHPGDASRETYLARVREVISRGSQRSRGN